MNSPIHEFKEQVILLLFFSVGNAYSAKGTDFTLYTRGMDKWIDMIMRYTSWLFIIFGKTFG